MGFHGIGGEAELISPTGLTRGRGFLVTYSIFCLFVCKEGGRGARAAHTTAVVAGMQSLTDKVASLEDKIISLTLKLDDLTWGVVRLNDNVREVRVAQREEDGPRMKDATPIKEKDAATAEVTLIFPPWHCLFMGNHYMTLLIFFFLFLLKT